jgi:hypothetical protein
MRNKWAKRIGLATVMSLAIILCVSTVALAVGTITDLRGVYTDTTLSLTWTKSLSTDTTIIRYSTTGFPATAAAGTGAYSGSGSYVSISGLTSGTTYYVSAFAYDGANYSSPLQRSYTTTSSVSQNTTIPYAQPAIPAEAWQAPVTAGWSWHPFDDILTYFSDPTYTHGGLGMPTDNLIMFLAAFLLTGFALFIYIKWHNFFAAYTILFIGSFFLVGAHIMQGYIIGLEILIGAGVWAVEHNFQ